MTTDELNTIVAAVVAELEKSGVDFDYKADQAKDDDLVFVIRGTAPDYQGVTVTWKGLLDIITAQATQAKNDAETAKNTANTILEQVQSKGTEITNFVATSKTEIETQKNESVNAVKSVYQTDLNELKGDLDYFLLSNKDNFLTPINYKRGYQVVGGHIAENANYGYIEVNVEIGKTYVSNIQIRNISGMDMETIVQYVESWEATYTGIAYFNFQQNRVTNTSYLCESTVDKTIISTYGQRVFDIDVIAQNTGNSNVIPMSQKAVTENLNVLKSIAIGKGNLPDTITDFDYIPAGSSYIVTSSKSVEQLANAPYYPFSGSIHTLSVQDEYAGILQIVSKGDGNIYYRARWASWGGWNQFANKADIELLTNMINISQNLKQGNLLAMYDNMTFCGDSLTWGQVYTDTANKASRQAKRPYPKIVAELCGANYEVLATKGYSATDWWNAYGSQLVQKNNNINIVYLGTNGGLTDTIDNDCPINGTVSQYANTNTGNYGKILKSIYDLGQKAILIKIYESTSTPVVIETNETIDKFGERFNFPVVEKIELTDFCYRCTPDKTQTGGVHYNDIGYSRFANELISRVNNFNTDMLLRLVPTT